MPMKKQPTPQTDLTRHLAQPKPRGEYSKDAHGPSYHEHGKDGSAFGKPNATAPMDYVRKTNAEGAKSEPVAGVDAPRSVLGDAERHLGSRIPPTGAHNIGGHAAHQRSGALRMSGVAGAHRVGKR
jgi:hypothetical protein